MGNRMAMNQDEIMLLLKYGTKDRAITEWAIWRARNAQCGRIFSKIENRIIALWWKAEIAGD